MTLVPGGSFLTYPTPYNGAFTPPQLPPETLSMADTMTGFIRQEVLPHLAELEAHEEGLLRRLMQRTGDLGLLAGSIPEAYGGLGLSRADNALLYERAALQPSFAITHNVHSGVATLPLVWFGTEEQKRHYLPAMASGGKIAAFALTEPNAGSDAFSTQCQAIPTGKGYTLTGVKNWITNAGVADIFTVFACIPEVGVTAFLVDRNTPGVSLGKEEEKLGLRGASTRTVFLDNVIVPESRILGEPGKGHRVALYPLNIGRLNIGASAVGAAKVNLWRAVQYARERHQFGRAIGGFDLIQSKLGEMAARVFTAESMVYRVCSLLDAEMHSDPTLPPSAAEEYAIECALVKIYATETLDFVVDECLQIHGGYGYSEAFPIARAYRDARVMRIFEGTNEINRLTVMDQLVRRIRSGRLQLTKDDEDTEARYDFLRHGVRCVVISFLECILPEDWNKHQEVAALCADMLLNLFASQAQQLPKRGDLREMPPYVSIHSSGIVMATTLRYLWKCAADLEDYPIKMHLLNQFQRILPATICDVIELRRGVAKALLDGTGDTWLKRMGVMD